MTDGPDHYAPPHLRLLQQDWPTQPYTDPEAAEVAAATAQHVRKPEPPDTPAKLTWLQVIAGNVAQLTYGEMKEFARGVLGPEATAEDVMRFADQHHEWSSKTRVQQ